MYRALGSVLVLMISSLLSTVVRADTVIDASSIFSIGTDATTQQFLSESLNGSFTWNGTTASNPVLTATGPIQGFSFQGTFFDTSTNTERGDFTNTLGDDFIIDFSFLQNGTAIVGDAFVCPSCQSLLDPPGPPNSSDPVPEASTLLSLSLGLAMLCLLGRKLQRQRLN